MHYSQYFIPTQRNAPQEALLASHKLMIRAGLIYKVSSGLYGYLPYGLLALRNVEAIIRDEMNKAGALETSMPLLIPNELLQQSGREKVFKNELFRLSDRNNAAFALSPTNEENFTDVIQKHISSYKKLPLKLYQISTKFRDEIRPRYGVMRSKEFIMKDAYSFHIDDSSLHESYVAMQKAYINIFTRLKLDFVHVQASSGAMGGSDSEEFIVKSSAGEETVILCSSCHYMANLEKASEAIPPPPPLQDNPVESAEESHSLKKVLTPGQNTIAKVSAFLKMPVQRSIKTLLYEYEEIQGNGLWLPLIVIIRGDYELNPAKLETAIGSSSLRLASEGLISDVFHCQKGYLSPIALQKPVKVIADVSLKGLSHACAGANEKDYHYIGVHVERDMAQALGENFSFHEVYQIRKKAKCPSCSTPLQYVKGIEVGHIFKLGRKYAKAFQLSVQNNIGEKIIPTMGCYGIGVNRSLAAYIETNNDEQGIIFHPAIAPFQVALISLGKDAALTHQSKAMYTELWRNSISTLWDDRDENPGVKFKDIDLIGIPFSLIFSMKLLKNQHCELKIRSSAERSTLPIAEAVKKIQGLLLESEKQPA